MSVNANLTDIIALPNRGQIIVEGADAFSLLQRLLTQNMDRLNDTPLIYSALLSPQGKFLHDMFIRRLGDNSFALDVEGGARGADLLKRLTMYRLRDKATMTYTDSVPVLAAPSGTKNGLPDPRSSTLGVRVYNAGMPEDFAPYDKYDAVRIYNNIPDGSRDAVIGESTLAELNIDQLAVDFKKGCFIGQELTARLHNMGQAKKHLTPVRYQQVPVFGADIHGADGRFIGDARSHCILPDGHVIGLACLKDDALDNLPPTIERLTI